MDHDDLSSVDDAAPVSSASHGDSGADGTGSATPPVLSEHEPSERLQRLMRDRETAEALARRTASEAAALRDHGQRPPRPEEFDTPDQYTRALARQAAREVGADILTRQAAQAQDVAARAAQAAWEESTAAFRQRVPDFEAVVHNPDLMVTPIMADAIRESARGAEIAYFLGKNPEEAARIAGLPPLSQATAIARLEGRLSNGQAKALSRAPQPVPTLSGRGGSGGKPLEDMSFEEYRRARGF